MLKKRVLLRHKVEYFLLNIFLTQVRITPVFMIRWYKRLLSFLIGKLAGRYATVVENNLNQAFPQLTPQGRQELKKKIYHHFAGVFVENISLYAKKKPMGILKDIEVKNTQEIIRVLSKGKGVVLFSGHFGNWELIPYLLNQHLQRRIYSVARRMNNPLTERVVKGFRKFMGSNVVDKKGALRTILKKMEENEVVYLLMDQNTLAREAVFVDFFGRPAGTVTSVAQLHLKKNIPIVPLFLHYERDKIVLEVMNEIEYTPSGHEDDIKLLTQKCTSLIEDKIKEHPEQWFWFHNRWKTKEEKHSA